MSILFSDTVAVIAASRAGVDVSMARSTAGASAKRKSRIHVARFARLRARFKTAETDGSVVVIVRLEVALFDKDVPVGSDGGASGAAGFRASCICASLTGSVVSSAACKASAGGNEAVSEALSSELVCETAVVELVNSELNCILVSSFLRGVGKTEAGSGGSRKSKFGVLIVVKRRTTAVHSTVGN